MKEIRMFGSIDPVMEVLWMPVTAGMARSVIEVATQWTLPDLLDAWELGLRRLAEQISLDTFNRESMSKLTPGGR